MYLNLEKFNKNKNLLITLLATACVGVYFKIKIWTPNT